jgi:type VI secretion system protein ImpJ
MKLLSRVVWSEGMYLGPHHFQVQSRYFEDSIQFATSSLWFASYGLAGVEMDAEALHNGTVSLLHGRGIFPDGLPFNMPESDALPEPRAIADLFQPTRDGIVAMLAIPPRKPNGSNCALDEERAAQSRYVAESRVLHDENTGADERSVRLGRKNLRLLIDTEPSGDLLTLPVARVVRDGAGHFIYDPNFVPPVLQTAASPRLLSILQRLVEILGEKSASISRGAGGGWVWRGSR